MVSFNMASIPGTGRRKRRSPRVRKAKRVVNQVVKALQKVNYCKNHDIEYDWAHSDIHADHPLSFQRAFAQRVGIEATEVFKGGSLGHGTHVPGHYDIDLVLYSRSKQVCEMTTATSVCCCYYEKLSCKLYVWSLYIFSYMFDKM